MSLSLLVMACICANILLAVEDAEGQAGEAFEPSRPWPRTCPESDRFGWSLIVNWIDDYEVGSLGAGWYHTFNLLGHPPTPAGLGFVQTVRMDASGPFDDRACGKCPTWSMLRALVEANPASLWVLGNEIDAPAQDYMLPDRYAELYHDLYLFLKWADPTCQVAIAGVVQPTPIRLQFLDLVLSAYQSRYGAKMPIDVFNTHNYILREKRWYDGCPDCWGCGVPLGIDADHGELYELEDHHDFGIWTGQLINLSTWMRDRGYRNRPLIVTEYGILFYDGLGGCNPQVTRDFMLDSFDWMRTYTDPDIGYPADGNRLVQAWNWYSLDHAGEYNDQGEPIWLGLAHLFDPDAFQITDLGTAYGQYTAGIISSNIEIVPTNLWTSQSVPGAGGLVTATVTAEVSSWGKDPALSVVVQFEGNQIPTQQVTIPTIEPGHSERASAQWPGLSMGEQYDITVTVNPSNSIWECDHSNNTLSTTLFIAAQRVYLPVVLLYR